MAMAQESDWAGLLQILMTPGSRSIETRMETSTMVLSYLGTFQLSLLDQTRMDSWRSRNLIKLPTVEMAME